MKISKRVREEAALLCAIGASTPHADGGYYEAQWATGSGPDATGLALAAWCFCYDTLSEKGESPLTRDQDFWSAIEAEAESLLRTGWTPE